jgi:hypothetical protein
MCRNLIEHCCLLAAWQLHEEWDVAQVLRLVGLLHRQRAAAAHKQMEGAIARPPDVLCKQHAAGD